ncbi:tetratricopeptide repeat protein [Mycoplana dimorpha]|uniref:Tetratricopeptide repeat protein n=1 Tax=Mycoplana dimorpha TaxID=28320 RepID=A0A2T5BC91_MYCDI|nr:tetratricopeptide repeat protein [Mycoplana dimorpha]
MERTLAVILAADVASYSRLVAADEEGTLAILRTYRTTIADLVAEHGGRIFNAAGDSVVVEFRSAVQAVRAGVAIQRALNRRNADLEAGRRLEFRIGINLGDVVTDDDNLLGDGVNIAARLQEIAAPAGICISGQDTPEHFAEAIEWNRRAIALDPNFARAHMMLARTLYSRCFHGLSDDVARDGEELCEAAEQAISLDSHDPYSNYALCLARFVQHKGQLAVEAAQRAIDLNPNLALAHMALGWSRIFAGHFAAALEPLSMAMRLSPNDPLTYLFLNRIALVHYHLGNHDEAIRCSERSLSIRRGYFNRVVLLASLGQRGRGEETGELVAETMESAPADLSGYWRAFAPYVRDSDYRHFIDGLRKSGMPIDF